jgi:hypothetical protein
MKAISASIALLAFANAAAADFPKEGKYDLTSCWGGTSSAITFSKTHFANNIEFTGTSRSNPPGGFGDMGSFRCIGTIHTFAGKPSGSVVCESVDREGDKMLSHYAIDAGVSKRRTVAGTGKYDGMTLAAGETQALGPFPSIKAGTVQNCNRQTGTYKLK